MYGQTQKGEKLAKHKNYQLNLVHTYVHGQWNLSIVVAHGPKIIGPFREVAGINW